MAKTGALMIGKSALKRMIEMSVKKPEKDAQADARNKNKGSPGTNRIYDQTQGNRGKQLNPNQRRGQGSSAET